MNVLEKILEEIKKEYNALFQHANKDYFNGIADMYLGTKEIIRSHMDEVEDMYGKRLIDANALDDEVINFFLAITGNPKQTTVVRECKESFRKMIDEQPTIYANDDWIPVEERLPEDNHKEVYDMQLVTLEGGEVCMGVYNIREKEWWTRRQEGESWYTNKHNVIAWQPLPEPYKGGDNHA